MFSATAPCCHIGNEGYEANYLDRHRRQLHKLFNCISGFSGKDFNQFSETHSNNTLSNQM